MSDRTGSGLENGIAGARNTNERTFHIRVNIPARAIVCRRRAA
jgi:hypothetical protein